MTGSGSTQVATYTYDTWGKLTSITGSLASTVGEKNPYRYRGYRYDAETGLYYLQSRYYNPEWGRFVNADVIMGEEGELLSHNMFAYCQNNPVIHKDDSGYWLDTALDVASLSYNVAKFVKNPTRANAKAIGFDVICMLIPGVNAVGIKALSNIGVVKKLASKLKGVNKSRIFRVVSKGSSNLTYLIKKKSLGRGSTGRTIAKNLYEQLAMKEVLSNPLKGAREVLSKSQMNDARWRGKNGWVKMQRIIKTSEGKINIHFNYNTKTRKFDDFKFK